MFQNSIWPAMLLVGLFGGGHCAGMCGPLALSVNLRRKAGFWYRLNIARLCGYTLLGGLAGAIGAGAGLWGRMVYAGLVLYVLAQLLLIGMGLALAGLPSYIRTLEGWGARLWRQVSPQFGLCLRGDGYIASFSGGLLWALLPCGLIYSALATALASASPAHGALAMLAFGVGTLPNLLLMGRFANELRGWLSRLWVRRTLGAVIMGRGVVGLVRGVVMVIAR